MKPHLTGLAPWSPKVQIKIERLPAVVGRAAEADVRIGHDSWISRVHCEISDLAGTLIVRDLGSKHGTFVNGMKVAEAWLLPGDRLIIGMTSLKVDYERQKRAAEDEPRVGTEVAPLA
jgi:pSer/pThr/pTyr-binding forkhead associated (FHA) protein